MNLISLEETNKEIGKIAELYARANKASDTAIVGAVSEAARQLAMAHAEAAHAAVLVSFASEASGGGPVT